MSKNQLREERIQARRAIPHSRLVQESRLVEKNLTSMREYREAGRVATYVSRSDEVQTDGLIGKMLAEGKIVVVPRMEPESHTLTFHRITGLGGLAPGHHGILEPSEETETFELGLCDLVIVPLVAWDDRGHRIGSGRGYFDRALVSRGRSVSVGLALESQRVAAVPEGPTDVRLDIMVTEKRIVRFPGTSHK